MVKLFTEMTDAQLVITTMLNSWWKPTVDNGFKRIPNEECWQKCRLPCGNTELGTRLLACHTNDEQCLCGLTTDLMYPALFWSAFGLLLFWSSKSKSPIVIFFTNALLRVASVCFLGAVLGIFGII